MPIVSRAVYTLEEANRALPLLRSIVSDVSDKWIELIQVREEYGNSSPEHDRIMRELADYVAELKIIGCHLRDFEKGIVEFPALSQGREIRLRWSLGQESFQAVEIEIETAEEQTELAEIDPEEEAEA